MGKISSMPHQSSRIDSDKYLDEVNLEELTDFFYETEALNSFGKSGKRIARAMAGVFVANTFFQLVANEEFDKNGNINIELDIDQKTTIH
jgi:hypothetical protein|tara:strand:- start:6 stop:275 length:270 start_codon:yes stop_codon:yes gene_type:complete